MIGKRTFDLESLVVFGDEKHGALTSVQNITLRFIKKVVGYNQRIFSKLADTSGIYGIWAPIPINGRQNDWSVVVVPGFTDVWR